VESRGDKNVIGQENLLSTFSYLLSLFPMGFHGIRDIGLLKSAIAQPEASFGGQ
jgi:hypothetical protein